MSHNTHGKGSNKTYSAKRTMNPPQGDGSHQQATNTGKADQQQDPARRLGGFESAGEHARTGNRGHQ